MDESLIAADPQHRAADPLVHLVEYHQRRRAFAPPAQRSLQRQRQTRQFPDALS